MKRHEFSSTLLGVVTRPPGTSMDEADVSAALGELDCQTRIDARDLGNFIKHGRWQKRIVARTQQERRSANARQEVE